MKTGYERMKLLVTGFEPFNGATINPSQLILEQLQAPSGVTLIKEVLPVEFSGSTKRLQELFEAYKPDVVVSLGQAGNRPEISVERVAINLNNVRSSNGKTELADNAGEKPIDRPIKADGEPAYFTTLPDWEMIHAILDAGVLGAASYTAGTYVCNHVMYTALYEADKHYPNMKAGFIHVPFLPEQVAERRDNRVVYSMELEDMVKGVQAALQVLVG